MPEGAGYMRVVAPRCCRAGAPGSKPRRLDARPTDREHDAPAALPTHSRQRHPCRMHGHIPGHSEPLANRPCGQIMQPQYRHRSWHPSAQQLLSYAQNSKTVWTSKTQCPVFATLQLRAIWRRTQNRWPAGHGPPLLPWLASTACLWPMLNAQRSGLASPAALSWRQGGTTCILLHPA